MWRMSGIFRDISLLHKPTTQISDLRINTRFNDDFSRAVLEAEVKVAGNASEDLRVTLQLWEAETLTDETTSHSAARLLMNAALIMTGLACG